LRSIRSFSRARTSERGFALIAALSFAILYFALMELLLVDSSRALEEARRFRVRLVAATVAENAVELAAHNLRNGATKPVNEEDEQGKMTGVATTTPGGGPFEIEASGETKGVIRQRASVRIQGRFEQATGVVKIDWAIHGY
jgi:hypothetical protein